ncbi:MAG: hypothetical protein ACRYFU_13935 [Janthinobacterium lividum]
MRAAAGTGKRTFTPRLPLLCPTATLKRMYEDFVATDRWTDEPLHCVWKGTVVAIATRHADATDIRFSVNDRAMWIAMPNPAWIEHKRRNGKVITDYLAAQAAGRYLKTAIESGYDNGRELYTMSVDEVLEHVAAVVQEAGGSLRLPSLPVVNADAHPAEMDFKLPAEPKTAAQTANLEPGVTISRG